MTSEQISILTEVIGVVGSILVIISYLFSSQRKLRVANFIACIISIIYGILLLVLSSGINGWSVLMLNAITAVIQIVWLVRNKNKKDDK